MAKPATPAPQASKTDAAPRSTAPGTAGKTPPAAAAKKGNTRVDYPGLTNAAGEEVKLSDWPGDFDPKKHKPLKRSNFADETVFMLHQADQMESKAKLLRAEVEQIRALGSARDVKAAKKISAMLTKVDELKAQLAEDGVDIQKLLDAVAAAK